MKLSNEIREQVIRLLQLGKSSNEIADELSIGKMQVAGVKAHLTIKNSKNDPNYITSSPAQVKSEGIPALWANTQPPEDIGNNATKILIGTDLIFNKKAYWGFHPATGSVNPHVLIVGETGFGKTYAAQCMAYELQKKKVSTIIFDYGQGFGIEEASKDFIALTNPTQIEASRNGVAINPLQIFHDDFRGPVNVAQRTADTFCRISPSMGIQQKEAIIHAVEDTFQHASMSANDKSTWKKPVPQFNQVHINLRKISEDDKHPLRNSAKTAYSHISSFFRFNIIRDSGEQLTWSKMIDSRGGVWVIQLKGLDSFVSMIITEMLLWNLISFLQSAGPSDLKMFLVLDEAHKLSFDTGTPVDWLLREGRKFGVGAILSSQQIEDYSRVAISNTATKIIFQNHDNQFLLSKALAKKCKNINNHKEISVLINTLGRGKAFFVTDNIGRSIKIDSLTSRR